MKKLISIITPFYNEEESIRSYFETIDNLVSKITDVDFDFIAVDDGSTDKTYEMLQGIHQKKKNLKVIKLSRNFGKEFALTAGLDHSDSDAVIPIDADLQDDPQVIPKMIKKWQDGNKVVLARRCHRQDPILKRITAYIFYKLANKIMERGLPENVGDFRLLDKSVVLEIKKMREHNRFMKGIFSWPGFQTTVIEYDRSNRTTGITKHNYLSLTRFALDGIFSFSTFPIRLITYCGFMMSLISFCYILFIICTKLFFGIGIAGYPSLMSVVLFIGGMNFIFIGIIGEYVGRIFNEVKNRPLYIVEEIKNNNE